MLIEHTTVEAQRPWPDDVYIQGGWGDRRPAFVEESTPGSFIRGGGPTMHDAEDDAWAKYQRVLTCAGGGEHGPYEARRYENGCGFCVKCGVWFSGVLPPSDRWRAQEAAGSNVVETYGEARISDRRWCGLVADETARLLAEAADEPPPVPTTAPPTDAELEVLRAEREQPLDLGVRSPGRSRACPAPRLPRSSKRTAARLPRASRPPRVSWSRTRPLRPSTSGPSRSMCGS